VLDPETGKECPVAIFDAEGRLANAEEAIGELVNTGGKALFEGYYKNDIADQQRMRDGMYWTGDLAYRDADGFLYFAGRDFEWLRVDGENFAAAPVERILPATRASSSQRSTPPDEGGDQVMAALRRATPLRSRRLRRLPRAASASARSGRRATCARPRRCRSREQAAEAAAARGRWECAGRSSSARGGAPLRR
jgi:acyl-CoA synthetase (AMP-forming)/AMP-acid ligase II